MSPGIIYIFFLVTVSCEPEIIVTTVATEECVATPAPLYFPGNMTFGRVAGLKNCVPFLASAVAHFSEDSSRFIALQIMTTELLGENADYKELMEWKVPDVIGLSVLSDSVFMNNFPKYQVLHESESMKDKYKVDHSYKYNRIYTSSIYPEEKKIKGWFEGRFIRTSLLPDTMNPDTILFTECHFYAIDPN